MSNSVKAIRHAFIETLVAESRYSAFHHYKLFLPVARVGRKLPLDLGACAKANLNERPVPGSGETA